MNLNFFGACFARRLSWVFLAYLLILPPQSQAQVTPGRHLNSVLFYFLNPYGPTPLYASLGEAYEAAKAPYAGDPNVYFTDITPQVGVSTINGEPAKVNANYMYRATANHPYSPGSVPIYVGYECPVGTSGVPMTVPGGQKFECALPDTAQPPGSPTGPECKPCKEAKQYQDSGSVGDPILTSIGAVEAVEEDFVDSSISNLTFRRFYRSDLHVWRNNFSAGLTDLIHPEATEVKHGMLGAGASSKRPIQFVLAPFNQLYDMVYVGRMGNAVSFGGNAKFSDAPKNINDGIKIVSNADVMNGYEVTNAYSGDKELFNIVGRLVKVTTRNGLEQRFYYSDAGTPGDIADRPGLLIRVTDHFGRAITFKHAMIPGVGSRLVSMTDPMQRTTIYKYDEATSIVLPGSKPVGNLTSVTRPDGTIRRYWYNEQALTANTNLQFALTGVTDERGVRLTTFKYDATGKAISTEEAGGVQKFAVTYYGNTSYVTDPLSAALTYRFQNVLGTMKMTQMTVPSPTGSTVNRFIEYDANGNLALRTDYMGGQTKYVYDLVSNLETSHIDAYGTALAR
ncbi:MAG TPA: hypothetical protein VFS95_13370, partial [Telluria sp.]|nr:hypothetical protein [Telluria sp.]